MSFVGLYRSDRVVVYLQFSSPSCCWGGKGGEGSKAESEQPAFRSLSVEALNWGSTIPKPQERNNIRVYKLAFKTIFIWIFLCRAFEHQPNTHLLSYAEIRNIHIIETESGKDIK